MVASMNTYMTSVVIDIDAETEQEAQAILDAWLKRDHAPVMVTADIWSKPKQYVEED